MLLFHAIGNGGCLGDVGEMKLRYFLSYDLKYAPPSVIDREINRAKNLGFIELKTVYQHVVFSDAGLKAIEEEGITMESFQNKKWHSAKALEQRARKMENPSAAGPLMAKAQQLRDEVSREGFFWYPEEWKIKPVKMGSPPSQSNVVTIAGDLKITKPPPKPKKMA